VEHADDVEQQVRARPMEVQEPSVPPRQSDAPRRERSFWRRFAGRVTDADGAGRRPLNHHSARALLAPVPPGEYDLGRTELAREAVLRHHYVLVEDKNPIASLSGNSAKLFSVTAFSTALISLVTFVVSLPYTNLRGSLVIAFNVIAMVFALAGLVVESVAKSLMLTFNENLKNFKQRVEFLKQKNADIIGGLNAAQLVALDDQMNDLILFELKLQNDSAGVQRWFLLMEVFVALSIAFQGAAQAISNSNISSGASSTNSSATA
jgi:hypothetical protein